MPYPSIDLKRLRRLVCVATIAVSGLLHAQDQLKIGPTSTDCASPMIVGATQCNRESAAEKKPASKKANPAAARHPATPQDQSQVSGDDPIVGGVKESEVNDFLANYGKPSREAARAILNPTDDNISALLKVERSQLAVVAYTAQRRVELTQANKTPETSELSQADLPALIGMRLTIVVTPDCQGCETILPMVNQLVTEFPSVDARIGVIGLADAKDFVVRISALGVYLPTAKISIERAKQLKLESLPAVIVGDSRFQGEVVLTEPVASALELERAVARLRRDNEKNSVANHVSVKG